MTEPPSVAATCSGGHQLAEVAGETICWWTLAEDPVLGRADPFDAGRYALEREPDGRLRTRWPWPLALQAIPVACPCVAFLLPTSWLVESIRRGQRHLSVHPDIAAVLAHPRFAGGSLGAGSGPELTVLCERGHRLALLDREVLSWWTFGPYIPEGVLYWQEKGPRTCCALPRWHPITREPLEPVTVSVGCRCRKELLLRVRQLEVWHRGGSRRVELGPGDAASLHRDGQYALARQLGLEPHGEPPYGYR